MLGIIPKGHWYWYDISKVNHIKGQIEKYILEVNKNNIIINILRLAF